MSLSHSGWRRSSTSMNGGSTWPAGRFHISTSAHYSARDGMSVPRSGYVYMAELGVVPTRLRGHLDTHLPLQLRSVTRWGGGDRGDNCKRSGFGRSEQPALGLESQSWDSSSVRGRSPQGCGGHQSRTGRSCEPWNSYRASSTLVVYESALHDGMRPRSEARLDADGVEDGAPWPRVARAIFRPLHSILVAEDAEYQ